MSNIKRYNGSSWVSQPVDADTLGGETLSEIKSLSSGKQDKLISGTNIKTINNQSILGSGNIPINVMFKFVLRQSGYIYLKNLNVQTNVIYYFFPINAPWMTMRKWNSSSSSWDYMWPFYGTLLKESGGKYSLRFTGGSVDQYQENSGTASTWQFTDFVMFTLA